MVRDLYIYISLLTHTVQPTSGDLGVCGATLESLKQLFINYIFFPMTTPVKIRPSQSVTDVQHGSACKIRCKIANLTLSYLVDGQRSLKVKEKIQVV